MLYNSISYSGVHDAAQGFYLAAPDGVIAPHFRISARKHVSACIYIFIGCTSCWLAITDNHTPASGRNGVMIYTMM